MSSYVLGVSAFGHDSSAALVEMETGAVQIAIAEERLSNRKHDSRLPIGAIRKCQEFAEQKERSISHVAVNFDETKFLTGTIHSEAKRILGNSDLADRLTSRLLAVHKLGFIYAEEAAGYEVVNQEIAQIAPDSATAAHLRALMPWYFNWAHKFRNTRILISELIPGATMERVPHHLSHAASAYLASGFDEATVVTLDGQGEAETGMIFVADSSGFRTMATSHWPNSLGIFYLMATFHLGFGAGDEYKVMGMSAYGSPRYADLLYDAISIDDDGSIRFSENAYFKRKTVSYGHFYFDFTRRTGAVVRPRRAREPIRQVHFDFAASVQKVLEDRAVSIVKQAIGQTGKTNVALAGGVALNGLMNERIRKESGCSDIFIFPASGDDGGSIGAAQYIACKTAQNSRREVLRAVYWGPSRTDSEIKSELDRLGIAYSTPESINLQIACALAGGEIVARYSGPSEFGPRALGNRSILADPRRAEMKEILNLRIKHREPFRPFAPACLYEHVGEYFDLDVESPFMLLIVKAKEKAMAEIPAVVHNDGTARVQTVTAQANPDFFRTISEYRSITGIPVLINTSFNVNGETIVETPLDAIESFGHMDIDHLAIGPYWVSKSDNADRFPVESDEAYLERRKRRYTDSAVWPFDQYNLDGILAPVLHSISPVKNELYRIARATRSKLNRCE